MKHYEMFCVLPGTLGEDEVAAVVDNVAQTLGSHDAASVTREDMGKSRLAYPIKHIRYGYFQLFRFELEAEQLAKLEKSVRLLDNLLRVVVKISDPSKATAYTLAQDPTALSAPPKADREEKRNERKPFEKKGPSEEKPVAEKKESTPAKAVEEKEEVKEEPKKEETKVETPKEEVVTPEVSEEKPVAEKKEEKTTEKKPKISIDDIDQKLDEILQKDIDNV
ncbi:30S ribosomal protein S6 [Candidatus Parcubacteria bacterium]|nr:MAG: 30S ribosomal protein S6 [Candidatus Parcubacteria bacterium]